MHFRLSDWVYVTRQDISGRLSGGKGWSLALVFKRKYVVGFGFKPGKRPK